MPFKEIMVQASQYTRRNFSRLIYIYLTVELMLLIVDLIANQLVAILLGVALVTFPHAYTVVSLRMTAQPAQEVSYVHTFVGLRYFAKLFPAYIMRKICLNLISFLILLPALLLIRFRSGFALGELMVWLRMIIVSGINDLFGLVIVVDYLTSPILIISLAIAAIVSTMTSYGLAMMPYLVEEYEISWNEAMIKSWRMMQGHKRDLLLLRLYYFPRMIFIYWIINLIYPYQAIIALILTIYLPITFYLPQVETAMALFYRYLHAQQKQGDLFAL